MMILLMSRRLRRLDFRLNFLYPVHLVPFQKVGGDERRRSFTTHDETRLCEFSLSSGRVKVRPV